MIPAPLRTDGPYPYVVVRFMAAAYGRRSVRFVPTTEPIVEPSTDNMIIQDDETATTGALSGAARQKLIARVLADVKRSGLRMCCVFGPDDAAFCERDGSVKFSQEAPSGGMQIDPPMMIRSSDSDGDNHGNDGWN